MIDALIHFQYVTNNTPPTVPPPLPSRLREEVVRRSQTILRNSQSRSSNVQYVNNPPTEFQLPPDGVYESLTQVNLVLARPPNAPLHHASHDRAIPTEQPSSPRPAPKPTSYSSLGKNASPKLSRNTTPSRVNKTPSRRCCKVGSSFATPKNSAASLGRGRRTPSRRHSSKYRARDVLEGKGEYLDK